MLAAGVTLAVVVEAACITVAGSGSVVVASVVATVDVFNVTGAACLACASSCFSCWESLTRCFSRSEPLDEDDLLEDPLEMECFELLRFGFL